jgi:hypothetical protein
MTTRLNERRSTKREALLALLATFGLLAVFAFAADAQDAPKIKDKDDKAAAPDRRETIVETGYSRPGNVDDKYIKDGEILPTAFKGADVKKFKILGGTVYFAVFKNLGLVDGDTFGTGMANIDAKFRTGRSFKDSYSPRFDAKAKYLYLYQVVNDRGLAAKGEDKKGEPAVGYAFGNTKAKVPVTEDIASFALKLLVDPRYITSWGHFSGAGFAANVVDVDINGKVVKNVVDDGKKKVERDKDLRLAFSYLPAIVSKIPEPAYGPRARAYPLGDLDAGFGVDRSTLNLQQSKAYGDLKLLAGKADDGNIGWIKFAENLLQDAEQGALEPNYVQLLYMSNEEREALAVAAEAGDDDLTRAIFRVDWDRLKHIKQGDRSVVFGFTTDLPPTAAPIRIDSAKGAALSEGMKLASYFSDEGTGRAPGDGEGIGLVAGGADSAALALAMGTALGQASTPVPAPAAAASGFAGITGGGFGIGGTPTGAGGGFAPPAVNGSYSRPGGGFGGGGGFGSGGGTTNGTPTQAQTQAGTQAGSQVQTINFSNTQTNQQAQAQAQAQLQLQLQEQRQRQQENHEHHHGHGHVVPAPASLLLGLLGLPGLFFLRRRKTEA